MTHAPYIAIRHDGWTAARQAHFLTRLARHGSVSAACAAVGKSCASAYRLRARADAGAFAAAWDSCLLPHFAFSQAIHRPAHAQGVEGGKGVEGDDSALRHQLHQPRATLADRRAWAEAIRHASQPITNT